MKLYKNNILHVVNIYFVLPYFIGGQFRYFKERGYNMFVACSASEYLDDYAHSEGFNYVVTPINRSISIRQDIGSIRCLCKYIRREHIGIVTGHTPKGGLIAMTAAWLMHVPVRIYFRHGLVYETSHGLKRFILKTVDRISSCFATKIICVSPSVLQRSIEDHLAPAKKQMVLAKGTCSGIDTQGKFNPESINAEKLDSMKRKWGIENDDYVIGYTGRLVRDKGIMELVRAFDILQQHDKSYKLLLVGMFEVRDALPLDVQEKIKNDSRIVWTDFQNTDMEYFYAMMNVYVLLSRREGFPTGVLEAQSMSVPVITTHVTGCRDSIIDGKTGLFVNIGVDELVDAIESLRNEHDTSSMSLAARQWVTENFDNIRVWKEIEKLYV